MTESDATAVDGSPADSAATPTGRDRPATHSRRRLLETLTVGGSMALAGCGLFQADNGTSPNGGSATSSQTFRLPVVQDPDRASFYAPLFSSDLKSTFALTTKIPVSGRLQSSVREPGVWVDKRWIKTNTYYTWLEDISITPTEVTVTIGNNATWSDGHPITGKDMAAGIISRHIQNPFPPYYATGKKGGPSLWWGAIDDFAISDKEVTYRSSPGYFEEFWDTTLRRVFGYCRSCGDVVSTHIEPYDAYAEAVFETARQAQQGEINPWKGWDNPHVQPEDPHQASLAEKYLAKGGTYVAKFSNPKHVISTSVWDLVELNGPEAVFETNSHHRNADNINFERLILEYTSSDKRARAALSADRLDYAAPGPTPQTVVKSLPDTITQVLIPGGAGSGNELQLNFNYPAISELNVRKAIMYALDQPSIANNIHQSAALPVTTPGGDCWDSTDYVNEKWIDENLVTYKKDRDRATSLMQKAGYKKDGKQWRNSAGEPLTLQLPTPTGTPRWEPTVARQLSEFGIQTSVQTHQEQMFESRVDDGKFPIWPHSGATTNIAARLLAFWSGVPANPERTGIYPKEQFQTGTFSVSGTPVPRTEERYDVFTIEAPPIGQPDGSLQEYHPSALAMAFFSNPSKAEFQRRVKTAMWLANWFLPVIPINKTMEQHFMDNTHWQWPTETPAWQAFTSNGPKSIDGILASGTIRANPDNPEKEA